MSETDHAEDMAPLPQSFDFVSLGFVAIAKWGTPTAAALAVWVLGVGMAVFSHYDKVFLQSETVFGWAWNISWSVSMVTVLPLVVAAIVHYYRSLPTFIRQIEKILGSSKAADTFWEQLRTRLNSLRITLGVVGLMAATEWVYLKEVITDAPDGYKHTWAHDHTVADGDYWNLTPLGLTAIGTQVVLTFLVLSWVCRVAVVAYTLNRLFEKGNGGTSLNPFHPDGVCGLAPLRERIVLTNFILFLLGLYCSMYFVDKIVIQKSSGFIGLAFFLAVYVPASPALMFLSLNLVIPRSLLRGR